MGQNVVGYLEVMIQNMKAENEALKKKLADMNEWGKVILADYNKLAVEHDEMEQLLNKIMQRVQGEPDVTAEGSKEDTADGV